MSAKDFDQSLGECEAVPEFFRFRFPRLPSVSDFGRLAFF
jgi:hypothetical protein